MSQYRWATKVLVGNWMDSQNMALAEALNFGQARVNEGQGAVIVLRPPAEMERRPRVI